MKKNILVLFTIISLYLFGCGYNFSDYSEELSGNYFFRGEGGECNDILPHRGGYEIPGEVLSYNYNHDFIIASQKPGGCGPYDNRPKYKEGKQATYYWIIVHAQKLVVGPMNKTEFENAKLKYNVPADLELKPVD